MVSVERAWRLVELLLARIDQRLAAADVPWLLVWMGHVDPDYYRQMRLRLEAIAGEQGIPYFDPSGDFAAAAEGEETFRIPGDGHWDRRGHQVLGSALARVVDATLAPPVAGAEGDDLNPGGSG